ncbi:MAG: CdaR family protein [Lachnospiraceae bacterium]|nr:CdaR family protein [Lachnospiraceae bacterium]
MRRKLTENLGLKIGSILFAVVLWLLVTNITNPSSRLRIDNVPVKIINTELITSQGKVYEVLEGSDVIDTVTIMLPRSLYNSISADNVVAVADMKNLTNVNTIKIELSTNKFNESLDSITGSSDVVKLNIEDRKSISIPLTASATGTLQEGYVVGNVTTDQNLVRVSGPESMISRIKKAEVNVTVTGFTGDIGTSAEVKLYDEEGLEIPKKSLTLNINNVGVKVEILTTKEVPLRFTASGVPAEGYRATGTVASSPATVLLAGKSNILKNLSVIELPESVTDLTGAVDSVTASVDIRDYLPEGISLADKAFDGMVKVTAFVEKEVVRNILITKQEDIVVANVPEGYEAMFSTHEDEFFIQVRGLAADVDALEADQIKGTIDIERLLETGAIQELQEGDYDVHLSFNLPDTVSLKENITVRVNLREKAGNE